MVVCIIAFFVFAFMALFSAKYRPLAKEAFHCVFLKLTLRPCDVKLDERIKAGIVGKLLDKSPGAARFVNKHFELLSWIFTIITLVSLAYLLLGLYNFFVYGSCDPSDPAGCILTQLTNATVTTPEGQCVIMADFAEFYGAECPQCKTMAPILAEVEADTGVVFEKLEVWHNETNQKTMQLHYPEIKRDCGIPGVPTFLSVKNKKAICGEITYEQLRQFVLENR